MYYVKRTGNNLWTVGYDSAGEWWPESDHESPEEAATECQQLNGAYI